MADRVARAARGPHDARAHPRRGRRGRVMRAATGQARGRRDRRRRTAAGAHRGRAPARAVGRGARVPRPRARHRARCSSSSSVTPRSTTTGSLSHEQHPAAALERVDHRAARRRRDDRASSPATSTSRSVRSSASRRTPSATCSRPPHPVAVGLRWSRSASAPPAGAVNGVVVTSLRVPSLVVTLGMLYVIRGIDGVMGNGHRRSTPDDDARAVSPRSATATSREFHAGGDRGRRRGRRRLRDAHATATSRDLYAIGSNPDAAALAGIPVQRRGVHSPSWSAARSPGSAGAVCAVARRHDRRQRRRRLRARTSSRPRWSAAWRSSAAAARSSAPRSAPCCSTRINQRPGRR